MEKLEMEKVISGLLTVNGCDPEKDTYVDITRLSRRLGFNVGNAKLDESEEGFVAVRPSSTKRKDTLGDKVIGVKRLLNPWDWSNDINAAGKAWDTIYSNGDGNHKIIPKQIIRNIG